MVLVIREYGEFLAYIEQENLTDVDTLRPLANGKEVAAALEAKPGPWMSNAMEMAIQFQLLHPECTEKEEVLEELRRRRSELGV